MQTQISSKGRQRLFRWMVVMAIVLCAGWAASALILRPRMVVSDIDLGVVAPGATVERAVPVENRGRGRLALREVKTCCGVATPYGVPREIEARSSTCIIMRIAVPYTYNMIERTVTITTNDRRCPIREIRIRGQLDRSVVVDPSHVNLGYVMNEGRFRDAIEMTRETEKVENALSVVTSAPWIVTSLHDDGVSGRATVDITILPEAPRGEFREYLYVKTGVPERRNVIIPVEGVVERGLRIRPQRAFFGIVEGKTPVSRKVRVEVIGAGWDRMEIEPTDIEGLDASLERKGAKTLELRLTLDPRKMPPFLNSFVTLRNMSSDCVRIPILAVRQDADNNPSHREPGPPDNDAT
jgi:hypothetical protein